MKFRTLSAARRAAYLRSMRENGRQMTIWRIGKGDYFVCPISDPQPDRLAIRCAVFYDPPAPSDSRSAVDEVFA